MRYSYEGLDNGFAIYRQEDDNSYAYVTNIPYNFTENDRTLTEQLVNVLNEVEAQYNEQLKQLQHELNITNIALNNEIELSKRLEQHITNNQDRLNELERQLEQSQNHTGPSQHAIDDALNQLKQEMESPQFKAALFDEHDPQNQS